VTTRTVLLWIHIVAAAAWLGCNLALFALAPRFARRGGEVAAVFAESTAWLARRYYNLAGTLLGVTGVLLVLNADYKWSSGFVAVGILTLVVGGALGIAVFAPTGDALAEAHRADDARLVAALSARTTRFLALDTTLVVLTVLAMVQRWRAR